MTRTVVLALGLGALACSSMATKAPPDSGLVNELGPLAALSPAKLPGPVADSSNKWADDAAAARLGQRFFMDPLFSGKLLEGDNDGSPSALGRKGEPGKVSCAGCHLPNSGFIDDRTLNKQISLASGWVLRRTPTLLDVGQAKLIMWDGRHDALYNQPFGPIENPLEMNSSRLYVAQQIAARYKADYEAIFGPLPDLSRTPPLDASQTGCDKLPDAQPTCHGKPGDKAEYDGLSPADQEAVTRVVVNLGKAIGAYERLLTCGQGRFDKFMQGDRTAMSASEQRGAAVFAGKGRCIQCHSGPFFTDQKFHNVGLKPGPVAVAFIDADDPGASKGLAESLADPLNTRGKFSDGDDGRLVAPTPADQGSFRTPGLRCISRHPSFMHTAQFTRLADVISFFDMGGHPGGYPGTNELQPLNLTEQERADLEAFLGALEGPGPSAELRKAAP